MASDVLTQTGIGFSTRSIKVLVVDDEVGDLRILRLTLESQGYEVFTCTTYEAGIQCLEAEAFDFVVVSQGSQAFEGRSVLDHAMQMGAIDYLEKPVPPTDLVRFVRAHVGNAELKLRATSA